MRLISLGVYLLSLLYTACSFSAAPRWRAPSKRKINFRHSQTLLAKHVEDPEETTINVSNLNNDAINNNPLSRRESLARAVSSLSIAAAATVADTHPVAAVDDITEAPTNIQIQVSTEYLARALDYFDGDMRKVLSAVVRSPLTKVQIDPPPRDDAARDAILRALYSYDAPEDYLEQARWLRVEAKDDSFVQLLTKKRYKFSIGSGEDAIRISLSNLEGGVIAGILSYPFAFAYYNYANYQEEQASIAKKAKMAEKRKAAAAKKKKAGDSKKEGKKAPKKGQAGKKNDPESKKEEKKGTFSKTPAVADKPKAEKEQAKQLDPPQPADAEKKVKGASNREEEMPYFASQSKQMSEYEKQYAAMMNKKKTD